MTREATTYMDGWYNFPALPPAAYDVTTSSPGFTAQVWIAITVGVGTDRVLNIVMHPGDPQKLVRTTAPPTPTSQAGLIVAAQTTSRRIQFALKMVW